MAVMREVTEDEVVYTEPTPTTNINVPGLWHMTPADVARQAAMLTNAWRIDELWDDESRANPGLFFMSHYMAPGNMLFDVENGAGLVAFIRTIPSWRTQIVAGAWARRAFGRDDLLRAACKIMMFTHDLLVIDSFVKIDNRLSQRATLRAGFTNRGIIKAAQCYNGVMRPMYWNEITRADLGISD